MIRGMRALSRGRQVFDHMITGMDIAAAGLILMMAFWMLADVIGRYGFDSPLPNTVELVGTIMTTTVFLGMVYALYMGRHVRLTIVTQRLSPLAREILFTFGHALGLIIFALVSWFSWAPFWSGFLVHEFEGAIGGGVPLYPTRFIIVFGSACLSIQFGLELLRNVKALHGLRKGS